MLVSLTSDQLNLRRLLGVWEGLTLDRDFWQLALQRPGAIKRSGVVLFRVHPAIPENVAPLVASMLAASHQWTGHVSIITPDGIEMITAHGA
jgi:hypothetical protein